MHRTNATARLGRPGSFCLGGLSPSDINGTGRILSVAPTVKLSNNHWCSRLDWDGLIFPCFCSWPGKRLRSQAGYRPSLIGGDTSVVWKSVCVDIRPSRHDVAVFAPFFLYVVRRCHYFRAFYISSPSRTESRMHCSFF